MKDYHINIFYSDEDDGYIADVPDLKACGAFGATAEEALREKITKQKAIIDRRGARRKRGCGHPCAERCPSAGVV